jgi:hypothetical protein
MMEELMVAGMRSIIKNVAVRVETAFMLNWDKGAKPVFCEDGEDLRLWTPDIMVPDPLQPTTLIYISQFPKTRKDELSKWLKDHDKAYHLSHTPNGYRALFEHGGHSFFGYQPLTSVPDLKHL